MIQSRAAPNHLEIANLVKYVEVCKFKILSNSAINIASAPLDLTIDSPLSDDERWLNMGERLVASNL